MIKQTPQVNPIEGLKLLEEANKDSLSELFSKNPLELTEEEIARNVEEYRRMRKRHQEAEMQGKRSLPKLPPSIAKPVNKVKASDIDI